MKTKLYLPGDTIQGVGMVDTNHFGLPWPATDYGSIYGTVTVHSSFLGKTVQCDALTGTVLTDEETKTRIGNKIFDYENREEKCQEWRKENGKTEYLGMSKVWNINKPTGGLIERFKKWIQNLPNFINGIGF